MNSSLTQPNFSSDYQEGAHARVLDALVATNMEQSSGYGTDEHCERARNLIRDACAAPDADVYFLVGGTQTNATVAATRSWTFPPLTARSTQPTWSASVRRGRVTARATT